MTSKTNPSKTRRFRPSPALILSCVALFMALTGSALAGGLVAKNSVRSPQIVNGTVRTVDLHDGSVQASKIAPEAVEGTKIATNAVDGTKIAPNAVGATQLAPNAVSSAKVTDQSLTAEDLAPGSVGSSEIQAGAVRASELGPIITVSETKPVATGAVVSVSVDCPAGTTVLSGGAQPANFGVELTSTLKQGNGWLAQAKNNSGAASSLTASAYCLSGGSSN
jgi:hypothetical protein